MVVAFASRVFTAGGSRPASLMRGNGMPAKLELSSEHASWLEEVRRIPCELAARMGVVSSGPHMAFEYRRNGVLSYLTLRKEIAGHRLEYPIEPKGAAL
jgi:hypothetical protein